MSFNAFLLLNDQSQSHFFTQAAIFGSESATLATLNEISIANSLLCFFPGSRLRGDRVHVVGAGVLRHRQQVPGGVLGQETDKRKLI